MRAARDRFPPPLLALLLATGLSVQPAVAQEATRDELEVNARPATSSLARRPDERRRASSRVIQLVGQSFTVGGEWEVTHESRRNLDLDRFRPGDRGRLDQELKLEASTTVGAESTLFLQLVGVSEIETRRDNGPKESTGALERGQMWLFVPQPGGLPFDLQLGRLSLIEARSWWWDEDLDAARIFFGGEHWAVEAGISQQLFPVSTAERGAIHPERKDLARVFGRAAWAWRKRHALEAYWLIARDHSGRPPSGITLHERRADESDADLTWLGLRAIGEERTAAGHRFGYWLDLARVSGRERLTDFDPAGSNRVVSDDSESRRVRGVGWDLGAKWSLPGKSRPTVWAGWAVGSGDGDGGDDTDHSFRQTGLEENKGRFGGVKRFRYYGELMRPTLANLDIRSIGASARFWERSSVDLVLHDYRQRQASDQLAASRLDQAPTGKHRALGQEIDLFLAFRESPAAEFTLSLATFRAGSAFGEHRGERAWFAELGMTLNF